MTYNFEDSDDDNLNQEYLTKRKDFLIQGDIFLSNISKEDFIIKASHLFFNKIVFEKYFARGELFSLKESSTYKRIKNIDYLFNDLYQDPYNSPRVIFFQSPPMIGMSYIIKYLDIKKFSFNLFRHSLGDIDSKMNSQNSSRKKYNYQTSNNEIEMKYKRIFDIIDGEIVLQEDESKSHFIIFRNLPIDLFIMSLKEGQFVPKFVKSWKKTINNFINKIKELLSKEKSNIKLIFFTDDKEVDKFQLKMIFPDDILSNFYTRIIICNQISKTNLRRIFKDFFEKIHPKIMSNDEINNLADSAQIQYASNLQQIYDFLIFKVSENYFSEIYSFKKCSTKKNPLAKKNKKRGQSKKKLKSKQNNFNCISPIKSKEKIQTVENAKKETKNYNLFHLLGTLLYNKRYVVKEKKIRGIKKEEFGTNEQTPRYYNIEELINNVPISLNSFNDLLIWNSIDHFKDIGEYSDMADIFSFSDNLDTFDSFLFDKNFQFDHTNQYMRTYLNCFGVTFFNRSQYNENNNSKQDDFGEIYKKNFNGLQQIKKAEFKSNKQYRKNKFEDQFYMECCEYVPSLMNLSLDDFYKNYAQIVNNEALKEKIKNVWYLANKKKNCRNSESQIESIIEEKKMMKYFEKDENDSNNKNGLFPKKNFVNEIYDSPNNIVIRNREREKINQNDMTIKNLMNDESSSGTDEIED